jgi:hypothetical protein
LEKYPIRFDDFIICGVFSRLKVVVERMLEELTDDVNMGGYVDQSFWPNVFLGIPGFLR